MTIASQDVEWENENGEMMTCGEFIMHHSCKREWENLGIYPTHENFKSYGIFMRRVEFRPGVLASFKVSVNDDSTLNFEIFAENDKSQVYYASYLKHVDDINQELRNINERFSV